MIDTATQQFKYSHSKKSAETNKFEANTAKRIKIATKKSAEVTRNHAGSKIADKMFLMKIKA